METPATQAADSGQIGWQLRKARKICRLSIENVALQLHIDPRVIKALEEDDFSQLKPVFVRGYLRNYARLVNLPVEPLLESYNRLIETQKPPPQPPSPSSSGPDARWGIYLLVGGLAFALFLWGAYEAHRNSGSMGDLQPGGSPLGEPSPASGDVRSSVPAGQATAPVSPRPEVTAPPGPGGGKSAAKPVEGVALNALPSGSAREAVGQGSTAEAAQPASAASPDRFAGSAPVGEGPDSLRVQVSADSWVAIRDHAGHRLAYETMPAGTDRTFFGQAPFAVVLGNSPAIHLEFNGQAFEQPKPRAGTVARFRVDQSRKMERAPAGGQAAPE
jgi:cytoskeleton protein RodZ